jgi:threonine dehydratase
VAYGLNLLKAAGLIFVPMNAAETKVKTIERFGGVVRRQGMDGAETELFARRYAAERGMTYISPYNDLKVIAGQGTIAIELCRQMDTFDVLFASLGGGGLIAGIAAYIKARRSGVALIGCSPVNSQVMIESVRANRILELESLPTLSDGTAGGIEPGAITFDLCRALVEEYESVREDEIGKAIRLILEAHHLLVEGSAGVAVAAYLKRRDLYKGKNIVIVLCGANIGLLALRQVLALPEQAPL